MENKENIMDDFEDKTTKTDGTDQTAVATDMHADGKDGGRKPADDGSGGKPHRRARVIAGVAALAVVAGLGIAFATGAFAPKAATTDEATPAVEQAADETADALTPTDVVEATTDLAFAGADVSVADTSTVSVTVSDGHVMVVETSTADAPTMVDGASRRCAALATSLDGEQVQDSVVASATSTGSTTTSTVDETATDKAISTSSSDTAASTPVTDVTWVTTDPTGTVVVAVTDTPTTAPTSGDSTADVINASGGHDMTQAAHDAIGGDASGIAKSGGTTPSKPDGTVIVPGTTVDTPAAATTDDTAAGSTDANTTTGTSASSSGSTTTSSSGSTSGSSSGSGDSGSTATSKTWVAEQGHWEPTYGPVWVQDSAAYDEQVYQYTLYTFSDGHTCTNSDDAFDYQMSTGLSYKDKDIYATVPHDATGHYTQQQTDQTWVVDVAGHWE